jgi:hypothetical protein
MDKSEALRLADQLDSPDTLCTAPDILGAAAELRRLYKMNQDLLEVVQKYIAWAEAENDHKETTFWERVEMCREVDALARAAIAKAEGEKT